MLHVPFRTSPETITAVLGKQVDVIIDTVSAVLGQVQSGQLKALAVTGKDRFPAVPNVPAAIESGVLPGLRRHDLVRLLRTARDAAGGHRQAQQDDQRDHRRTRGARAPDQGGRGREGLDAGSIRQVHGRRICPLGQGARDGRHRAAIAEATPDIRRSSFRAARRPRRDERRLRLEFRNTSRPAAGFPGSARPSRRW